MMIEMTSWKFSCWKRSSRSCAWIMRSVPRNASVPPLSSGISFPADDHVHPGLTDRRFRSTGMGLHALVGPPAILTLNQVTELRDDVVRLLTHQTLPRSSEKPLKVACRT